MIWNPTISKNISLTATIFLDKIGFWLWLDISKMGQNIMFITVSVVIL